MYNKERLKAILGMQGDVDKVLMTPDKASLLLELNTKNRAVSNGVVNNYTKAMLNGEWKMDSDAISIDTEGYLSNGQHRLMAVKASEVSVEMLVALDVDNHPEMDRGNRRTISDNVALSKRFEGKEIVNHKDLIQLASTLVRIDNSGKSTTREVENLLEIYGDKMLEAKSLDLFKATNGVKNNAISAAIFTAYVNHVDLDHLRRTRTILNTGIVESVYDSPIIALRDRLIVTKGGGAAVEKERYRRTMYCICALERKLKTKKTKSEEPRYNLVY